MSPLKRGACRSLHNTYRTDEGLNIGCTKHLGDSCRLIDLNAYFIQAPLKGSDWISTCKQSLTYFDVIDT